MDPRILRIQELFRQMDEITAEIAAMLVPAPTSAHEKAGKSVTAKKGSVRPCCGSKGARHKNGCPGESAPAPAAAGEPDMKRYTCSDCHQLFEDERDYLDVVCPNCDGHACIQKH